ncbi:cytochrome P450 [Infundibulicybe gibba]|nr:cytochrome P450 [Infundibulicybe gibba]
MDNSLISLLAVLVVGYIYRCYLQSTNNHSRPPLPPGPKPKLLIGNALDIPTRAAWLTYTKWAETYGSDILHVEALGQHIIILNSREGAIETMEGRASNYSSRPIIPMLEMRDVAARYESIQMDKVRRMLKGLLDDPDNFRTHIRTVVTAIVLAIVYGHHVSAMDDKYVVIAETALDAGLKALLPGAALVNTLPALRHVPPWLPGGGFHQIARQARSLVHEMKNAPFNMVRKHMRDGTGEPSLLRGLLENNDANGGSAEQEAIFKDVCATAYGGGADTTASTVATFFCAMATNPGIQRKAQDEIDAVIGNDRLPELGDRSSLPYVEALYREVMHWHPVVPLGLPHTSADDDIYKGFFIPKGSIVFANIWAMTHDENIYKDPDSFQPERYFENGRLNGDDMVLAFGFGRCACVGRHLASTSTWLIIASVLATLNIGKAKDSHGNDIEIGGKYSDGAISHPDPFPCSVTPRSLKSRGLIESDE